MNFNIPCETYIRLSHVAKNGDADFHNCLYVCQRDNVRMLIVTNRKIAAFEFLGKFDGPDFETWVSFDPVLLNQANIEKLASGHIFFVNVPDLKFVSAKTTMGYTHPGNVAFAIDTFQNARSKWHEWRSWLPDDEPVQHVGSMFMNADHIANLGYSSPSGRLVFPEIIDNRKPVVVRDILSENWFGLFMANRLDDNNVVQETEPAVLPDWVK